MDVENNLAILLGRMGEAKLGREHMEHLVPMRREVLGADHEDTLGSLHNLAVMRIMTGDSEGALSLQRQLVRSEEHTSELQSLMRISYAVFCLKKKKEISMTHH